MALPQPVGPLKREDSSLSGILGLHCSANGVILRLCKSFPPRFVYARLHDVSFQAFCSRPRRRCENRKYSAIYLHGVHTFEAPVFSYHQGFYRRHTTWAWHVVMLHYTRFECDHAPSALLFWRRRQRLTRSMAIIRRVCVTRDRSHFARSSIHELQSTW